MLIVGLCYILMATGVPKILVLFSSNLSILFNGTVIDIMRGVTFGSFGGLIGKSICSSFINKLGYTPLMTGAFFLSLICLVLEFCNVVPMGLYGFYTIHTIQGFLAGIIYSGLLAYLGENFSGEKYKRYLTIITGGLGLAGPLFGLCLIIFDLDEMVRIILIFTLMGGILSYFSFQTQSSTITTMQTHIAIRKPEFSLSIGIKLLIQQKSIFLFAFSFAANVFGSLLILNNTKRLLILFLHNHHYTNLQSWLVRLLWVLPLIGGGFFFFLKKTEKNYILISLLLLSIGLFYCIINSIYLCFIILIIAYGLHLILIPVGSDVFLSHQSSYKAYYSYIIHTIRSLYTILFAELERFINYPLLSFNSLVLVIIILHLLSFICFLLGRKYINLQKNCI